MFKKVIKKQLQSILVYQNWRRDPEEFVKHNLEIGYRFVTLNTAYDGGVFLVDLYGNKPKNIGLKGVTYWEDTSGKLEPKPLEKVSREVVETLGINKNRPINLNKVKRKGQIVPSHSL